ncbi:MAG: hypothetical protein ACOYNI_07560 [Acidimicrobiia bacterium]
MLVPTRPALVIADTPNGPTVGLLAGIDRVRAALRRRYQGTAGAYGFDEFCWLGGRSALALHDGDAAALAVLAVDVHLRHPEWFDETQLDHWFGDFFPSIERPDRVFDAHDGRVERRGLAARLLHTLSLDDRDQFDVIIVDETNDTIDAYERVPILSPGRVIVAELWRVAISLRRPLAHPRSIGRSVYALVTLLEAERRLGPDLSAAMVGATTRLVQLPVQTRRGDDTSWVEVMDRVVNVALERLSDPLVVRSAEQEFGDVDTESLARLADAIRSGLAQAT